MSLKVSRILHAGYIFECDGYKIAFDPLFENPFSQNCYAYPSVEFDYAALQSLALDAVFISHYHDDHFSLESLNFLNRETPVYIFSIYPELLDLVTALGFHKVYDVELFKPLSLGPFEIVPLEALDADVDSIYHIKAQGKNILNVVDSWIGPRTMERLLKIKWDLILWPLQTMREIEVLSPSSAEPVSTESLKPPVELMEQLKELNPVAVIASACQFRFEDWSWYNHAFFPITYREFEKQVATVLPQAKVLGLNPGRSLEFDSNEIKDAEPLSWIHPLGPQDVDYDFKPDLPPQSISEIARLLPAASAAQKKQVREFCLEKMRLRYAELSELEDSYFFKPRVWRLTTFNEKGQATHYHYQVQGAVLKIAPEAACSSASWFTEIPEVKLYNALEEGESLTSIYMRVANPPNSDPLEDPLLRSLYEGIVGSYQKAQLKKLGISAPRQPLPSS